jgi:hypothetical protein
MQSDPARGWSLLRNVGDWDRYRVMMSEHFQVDPQNVSWGKGPSEFPCLACSYPASKLKIVGCYVYKGDAMALLNAGGFIPVAKPAMPNPGMPPQQQQKPFMTPQVPLPPRPQGSASPAPDEVRGAIQGAMQLIGQTHQAVQQDIAGRTENDKSVIAHLLTIIWFLVETGIAKQPQYEEHYAAKLAEVDQLEIEQRRALLQNRPTHVDNEGE